MGTRSAYYGVRAAHSLTNLARRLKTSATIIWKVSRTIMKLTTFMTRNMKKIIMASNSVVQPSRDPPLLSLAAGRGEGAVARGHAGLELNVSRLAAPEEGVGRGLDALKRLGGQLERHLDVDVARGRERDSRARRVRAPGDDGVAVQSSERFDFDRSVQGSVQLDASGGVFSRCKIVKRTRRTRERSNR